MSKQKERVVDITFGHLQSKRSTSGTALIMSICLMFILTIAGLAVVSSIALFGGFQNLKDATDAGALNAARNNILVGVKLLPDEVPEFGDLVDSNGLITMRTYNEVVARAIIVVLDAQEIGDPDVIAEAKLIADMAQCGDNSIGKRLHDAIENAATSKNNFDSLSQLYPKWSISKIAQDPSGSAFCFYGSQKTSDVYIDDRFLNSDQLARLYDLDVVSTIGWSRLLQPYYVCHFSLCQWSWNTIVQRVSFRLKSALLFGGGLGSLTPSLTAVL